MTSTQRLAAVFVSLSVVLVGCLGEVLPKRVVAGTTFTFPFNGNLLGPTGLTPVLYGADPDPAMNPRTLLKRDAQRGNARFVLCTNPEPNCGTQRNLSFRYVTRVFPDRGTKPGRDGNFSGLSQLRGQDLVVLDVPTNTPAGNYQLTYVYRVPPATMDTRVTLQPITVVAGTVDAFSDISKALNFSLNDVSSQLKDLIPEPQVVLSLVDGTNDRPAAGRVVVTGPSTVTMQDAFEGSVLGIGSLVRTIKEPGKVTILFVDPDQKLFELRVPFTLNDPNGPAVALSQFQVEAPTGPPQQRLYKLDGSLINFTTDPNAPTGNSFKIDTTLGIL
jgi:hypothetical protein